MDINIPDKKEILIHYGDGFAVEYISDKSGKKEVYRHEFKKGKKGRPMLLTDVKGSFLLITGGNLKVKPEGITG